MNIYVYKHNIHMHINTENQNGNSLLQLAILQQDKAIVSQLVTIPSLINHKNVYVSFFSLRSCLS